MDQHKSTHILVLDAGGIIKNEPPVSTLLKQCEQLVTVPAIISEIKDSATRSRIETTLRPFLTVRSPSLASVKFVTDFARRTGDLAVLSKPDVQIIALTYEIECERNGGDWRLRRVPGQKGLNGAPPANIHDESQPEAVNQPTAEEGGVAEQARPAESGHGEEVAVDSVEVPSIVSDQLSAAQPPENIADGRPEQDHAETDLVTTLANTNLDDDHTITSPESTKKIEAVQNSEESLESSDSDSEGWITPSNLKKKQAEDAGASTVQAAEQKIMQVAVLTTDFAMQNVILQMNLNLLSPSLNRVKHLKTFVLRCHACFQTTKDMSKQFCPRCGQPALTRVSCSTSANGEFKLHLKKNMQWNSRGDRYSVPKPVSGSANGRVRGGGKDSWGHGLVFAEDQKEYQRSVQVEKRQKARDLMDEDYLPSILTGDRSRTGGRIKVGAGRNVNSRKR